MDKLNAFLDIALLDFGNTHITIGQIIVVLLTALLGSLLVVWITRVLKNYLATRIRNQDLVQMLSRAFLFLGFFVVAFVVLDLLQIPLTAFAFISGAVAIGFGFGAQNVINNFISGWILMWERPIRIGDFLELGVNLGTVETINTRFTRLRRIDGVRLMIPNSQLLENTVINWTIIDRRLRSHVRVGVQYGSDVPRVKELLEEILAANEDVLEDPEPTVIFEDFGDSSLVFDAFFWIESTSERSLRGVRSALRFEIERVFRENGVVIAFPQRDIHLDTLAPLDIRIQDDRPRTEGAS